MEESAPPPAEPGSVPAQDQPDPDERPASNGDRKKWEAAELPALPVAQQTLEETCATTSSEFSLTLKKNLLYLVLCRVLTQKGNNHS